jgi:hypothetical protein
MVRWIDTTTLLGLLLGQPATAQTPSVIYLSCDGTMQKDTADTREQVTKWELVVNLADQTVVGFGIAAHIDQIDASSIAFSGEGPVVDRGSKIGTLFAEGAIDRVTGIVSATTTQTSERSQKTVAATTYYLVCNVTDRQF